MLALRQQAHGLLLLGQLLERQYAHPATASRALWQLQAAAALHRSPGRLAATDKLGAIAGWLADRMPASLGGSKDGDLDFESEDFCELQQCCLACHRSSTVSHCRCRALPLPQRLPAT